MIGVSWEIEVLGGDTSFVVHTTRTVVINIITTAEKANVNAEAKCPDSSYVFEHLN